MINQDVHPTSGSTRVDHFPAAGIGPARQQQPRRRDRDSDLPDRHLAETKPDTRRHGRRAAIAAIASAHADPAGPGSTGSDARSRHQPVNTERTASTRAPKRRSQPRTVSAGRPSNAAINRCPAPAAFAVNPAPITASTSTGNST
jgi:hypothetical protein